MIRIYIMPLIGGGSRQNPRRPKYAREPGVSAFGSVRYGEEGICLVAMELTQQAHNVISADAEVISLPEDIDGAMGQEAVNQARQFLEANNIPGDWVNTSHTFRLVLRVVLGCFLYTQRFAKLSGKDRIFLSGIDLTTQIRDIPAAKRGVMAQAADELGLDYSTVTGTWTLRQYLKHLADQWRKDPINLNVIDI